MQKNRLFTLAAIVLLALGLITGIITSAGTAADNKNIPISPTAPDPDQPLVVRFYYTNQAVLNAVAGQLDIWEVNKKEMYAVAMMQPQEYVWLESLGYRLEIDTEKTQQILAPHAPLDARFHYFDDNYTNPNGLYVVDFLHNISDTFPTLTELSDIGNGWQGDDGGYNRDIWVLRITNEDPAYGNILTKPAFYLFATIHAREVSVPELAIRYTKYLTEGYNGEGGYGVDADATWLVDHNVVYILVMQNPDGHRANEANTSEYRRKNMNNDACGSGSFGVDLNRNSSFMWGCCGGSSSDPCSETYRGPIRNSEPETQAFQSHFASVMLDQNGPNGDDELPPAAPDNATGIFISLHSYSDLVLWPWAFDDWGPSPNNAQMETIARKFASYNGYNPDGTIWYDVDGATDDWTYGKFGIASYTFEVGSSGGSCGGFFPAYGCVDGIDGMPRNFWAENGPAFIYAHKIARTPYMTVYGPDTENMSVIPGATQPGTLVDLAATITDHRYGGDTLYPITAAEYFVDTPGNDGTGTAMSPSDGSWGATSEGVEAVFDTTGLAPGQHYILVHGQNDQGDWGPFTAAFIYVIESGVSPVIEGYVRDAGNNAPIEAAITAGTFQATSDPATGYYSMTVISGTYAMNATATGYADASVSGVIAQDYQTVQQNFLLYPVCDIFTDTVESGNQGWTAQGSWAITTEASHSPSHSWTDSPGVDYGNYWDYSLTSPVWDLSEYEGVTLDFWHIYDLEDGYDYGYLEYSTNGSTWMSLTSYNGENQTTWMHETVDISALDGQATAQIRFRLDTDSYLTEDGWHIDDIIISGGGPGCGGTALPPTAAFTSDSPGLLGLPMHFTNLTTGTLPINYVWDFGDSSIIVTDINPTHTYAADGFYTVTLTATNSLGSDVYSDVIVIELPSTAFSLTKTASVTEAHPGEIFTYTVQAHLNLTGTHSYKIQLLDPIPSDVTALTNTIKLMGVPAPELYDPVSNSITATLQGIFTDTTGISITFQAMVNANATSGSLVENQATAQTWIDEARLPGDRQASASVTILPLPALVLSKTASVVDALPGEVFTYTLGAELVMPGERVFTLILTDTLPEQVNVLTDSIRVTGAAAPDIYEPETHIIHLAPTGTFTDTYSVEIIFQVQVGSEISPGAWITNQLDGHATVNGVLVLPPSNVETSTKVINPHKFDLFFPIILINTIAN